MTTKWQLQSFAEQGRILVALNEQQLLERLDQVDALQESERLAHEHRRNLSRPFGHSSKREALISRQRGFSVVGPSTQKRDLGGILNCMRKTRNENRNGNPYCATDTESKP